jgi:hypothetical protein
MNLYDVGIVFFRDCVRDGKAAHLHRPKYL